MALKGAYTAMKTKLLKYEPQVKRKPIFPITTMLDPSLKFEFIPNDEQDYITKTLKHLLQSMLAPPISSACSQSEPLSNTSTTCSKMMVKLMNHKRNKIGSEKYPRLAMLSKGFLLVCDSSSPSKRLFSSKWGIVTHKGENYLQELYLF